MTSGRIICVGGVTLDRVMHVEALPSGPGKSVADGFAERGGGMAATAAVAIKGLGGDVHLWSRVGDDPGGRMLLEQLADVGIPTDGVRTCRAGRSATSFVHVDHAGERTLTNFPGDLPVDAEWLPLEDIAQCQAVLGDTRWESGVAAAFAAARTQGVPTVLDADAGSPEVLRRLVPLADHVIFSAQGLAQLTGYKPVDDALAQVASRFHREKPVLGVTLGDAGSLWRVDSHIFRVPAIEVPVINTNGVGDVFHGAYAFALVEGLGLQNTIKFANAAAATKCSMKGGWETMPSRQEVKRLLAKKVGPPPLLPSATFGE